LSTPISEQLIDAQKTPPKTKKKQLPFNRIISTGSTLLDLAISGKRIRGGGLPSGILVEIFGPSGAGKTVLLCEMAGNMQRANGSIMFNDPEARLDAQFAKLFDFDVDEITLIQPDTIKEVFAPIRKWEPESTPAAVFADSLAALSTNLEMDKEEGDKMGMRRAKEFSEECRKTCRILSQKDILMVCSNQVRVNQDAGPYGEKYKSPGGEAIGFYASLRLKIARREKIKETKTIRGKEQQRVVGVVSSIQVYKSSIDAPFRDAMVHILFDYGIDDIRANLTYLKQNTKSTKYAIPGCDVLLGASIKSAALAVEKNNLEEALREAVIDLWEEIEETFITERKQKKRL